MVIWYILSRKLYPTKNLASLPKTKIFRPNVEISTPNLVTLPVSKQLKGLHQLFCSATEWL
jgi:hypothetical protein